MISQMSISDRGNVVAAKSAKKGPVLAICLMIKLVDLREGLIWCHLAMYTCLSMDFCRPDRSFPLGMNIPMQVVDGVLHIV